LPDILSAYFEWRRTGILTPTVKHNQDKNENLECAEQIWIVPPQDFKVERIDAFAYCPDLASVRIELSRTEKVGTIKIHLGKEFVLRKKLTKSEKNELRTSDIICKYIEIGDVTKYGLILKFVEAKFDELPTRAEHRISEGDILFAINNSSRGTVVIVPKEFDGALCTSGFYVIQPRTKDEGLLLWWSLRSEHARKQIYYLAQTASQPELKITAWKKLFKIPMPIGDFSKSALQEAEKFQKHLSALLNADKCKFST
jgi:restriction endonuclease S subunit